MKRSSLLCSSLASHLLLLTAALASSITLSAAQKLPPGYSIQTIDIPKHITLGVGGLAFMPSGDLMISTREGEVWRYRPDAESWTLFAEGLHEALGVYVDQKTSEVWVMQRPELTQLIDEDGDGRADLYRTVNAGWGLADNYHEYAFGPVRDAAGNFYGTLNTTLSWKGWAGSDRWDIGRVHDSKMGRSSKYRGWSFQITPNGTFVPWSSGMRSPCGLGMNRAGEIFYTDNQGDWNGSSTLQQVVKGRFHGHPSSLMDHPDFQGKDLNAIPVSDYEKLRTLPAVWFVHGDLANSPGAPEYDETGGKFGPFQNQIFVGDQTRANLMRIFLERVDGEYQGAIFDFIDPVYCGVIRNVFGPDGSLWLGETGRGWTSIGGKMFGLERVRWDGKTVPMEIEKIHLTKTGFQVVFTKPVDAAAAGKIANYPVRRWHYLYRSEYGSPKADETEVPVTQATLLADGRTVDLELPLQKEHVFQIGVKGVTAKDGSPLTNDIGWYTLNRLQP